MSRDRHTVGRVLRKVGRFFPLLYRVHIRGQEHVPEGGAILSGNHVSYLDPMIMWVVAPRKVHFMAKAELFEEGFLSWLLPRLWTFPVKRGQADREAIATATDLLRSGELVGIFPEGTRRRDVEGVGEMHSGAAFLALRSGCPIVPFGIAGTQEAMPEGARFPRFPKVAIVYGEPIYPEDFPEGSRKERVEKMTAAVVEAIAAQLEMAEEDR